MSYFWHKRLRTKSITMCNEQRWRKGTVQMHARAQNTPELPSYLTFITHSCMPKDIPEGIKSRRTGKGYRLKRVGRALTTQELKFYFYLKGISGGIKSNRLRKSLAQRHGRAQNGNQNLLISYFYHTFLCCSHLFMLFLWTNRISE